MPANLPLGRIQPDYELRLCDATGIEVEPGEVGEICVIGPGVSPGYWRDPVLTAAKRLAGRADSYRTGDLAYRDEAGTLHFAGRRTQLVKLRGHRFDLGEIEAPLKRHPDVREAIALTEPGDGDETVVRAVVEATVAGELEDGLMRLCAERLPRYAWPARLLILAELPRLPNGKVDRRRLAADSPRT